MAHSLVAYSIYSHFIRSNELNNTQAETENVSVETLIPFNTGEVLTTDERDKVHDLITNTLPPSDLAQISPRWLWNLPKSIFGRDDWKTLSATGRSTVIRRVIYACVVRQIILNKQICLPPIEEVQQMHFYSDSDFLPIDEEEELSLRRFLRAIKILCSIGVSGKNNKQTFVEVGGMLDGANRTYAFGGAPSKATMRRAFIFHVVTNVPMREAPRERMRRRLAADDTSPSHSSFASSEDDASTTLAEMLTTLMEDDIDSDMLIND